MPELSRAPKINIPEFAISRELVKAEIRKWGVLNFPPNTSEAMAVLVDTLHSAARSEGHCRQIVKACIDEAGEDQRWPSPDLIRRIAWRLLEDSGQVPRQGCEECGYTGFQFSVRRVRGVDYGFAAPCACRAPQLHDGVSDATSRT